MKLKYREVKLSEDNKKRLKVINQIIEEYQKQSLILTLRQLYYQLVSRAVIMNKQSEYTKLSILLREGRMGGIVDWSAIEDRLRVPEKPSSWNTPKDIMKSVIYSYALPRMKDQDNYIEVWVEKDALSGVLSRVTQPYHIPILVNRGYSSATAMHEAFKRFKQASLKGQYVYVIYLGDFDPSGLDMINDINNRITEFDINNEVSFVIRPIALTKEQIKQYKPPPNPAKKSDPRAKEFIEKNGSQSWEVDALRPEVLNDILTTQIESLIDRRKYEDILLKEQTDIKKLKSLSNKLL